jgi:hypothetical protein
MGMGGAVGGRSCACDQVPQQIIKKTSRELKATWTHDLAQHGLSGLKPSSNPRWGRGWERGLGG